MAGCEHADRDPVALPAFKGHHRVIVVVTPKAKRAAGARNALASSPGLKQWDIVWFVVGPNRVASSGHVQVARKRLAQLHTVHAFQAVLIGKNGKLLASQLGGLDIQGLLDAIHQLPTRQQERQQ